MLRVCLHGTCEKSFTHRQATPKKSPAAQNAIEDRPQMWSESLLRISYYNE